MKQQIPFTFISEPEVSGSIFRARLGPNMYDRDDLLNALYASLWFPAYFGFNWDALFECLRDFEWLDEHSIVLVHTDLPKLQEAELKIYLEILRDAILFWNVDGERSFEVVFEEKDRILVHKTLTVRPS